MPKVTRITLESGSVANSLNQVKRDMLPSEIAENELAKWVMSFDELEKGSPDIDVNQERTGSDEPSIVARVLMNGFAGTIFQQNISFYFAALFHIGRQWRIAELSLRDIESIQQERNFQASVANLYSRAEKYERSDDGPVARIHVLINRILSSFGVAMKQSEKRKKRLELELRQLCALGLHEQSRQLSQAQHWWTAWQSEVEAYRNAFLGYQEYNQGNSTRNGARALAGLLRTSSGDGVLKQEMQFSGLHLRSDVNAQASTGLGAMQQSWWLLGIGLAFTDPRKGYIFPEFYHYLYDFLYKLEKSSADAAVMEVLQWKYRNIDPFEKYMTGQSAPTQELLQLIREHRLGRGYSPWLSVWERSLEPNPDKFEPLDSELLNDNAAVPSLARSADSTIKRSLMDEDPKLGESWGDFIQRLFEEEWVRALGEMAVKANKASKGQKPPWDAARFEKLLITVIARLKTMGYALVVPKKLNLKALLDMESDETRPDEESRGEGGIGFES